MNEPLIPMKRDELAEIKKAITLVMDLDSLTQPLFLSGPTGYEVLRGLVNHITERMGRTPSPMRRETIALVQDDSCGVDPKPTTYTK